MASNVELIISETTEIFISHEGLLAISDTFVSGSLFTFSAS